MIAINTFLVVYLGIYLFSSAADLIIDVANARNPKKYKEQIPEPFRGIIDEGKLRRMNRYTLDKTN
ncbi:MAG: hypothetical protein JSW15_09010, partial [Deltaproteobacteria bacterium]